MSAIPDSAYIGGYFACGLLACFWVRRFLLRRGVGRDELNDSFRQLLVLHTDLIVLLLVVVFWPVSLLIFALLSLDAHRVRRARARRAMEKEEEARRKHKYSDMSLDEMLAVQRKMLNEAGAVETRTTGGTTEGRR